MATQATYYLDAPSLGSATVVYSNSTLTTVAPNGYYSDGVIVREQVSGVLLPQVICPSCSVSCNATISESGAQGIYYLSVNLGNTTGAVVVEFNPQSVPDGIVAVFNSVTYNGVSSPSFGWLQGTAGLPTYIGNSANDCGIVSGSPYTLNEFGYDGTDFYSFGTTQSVSVVAGQMDLTAGNPGACIMVIPKTTASPSVLNISIIGACVSTIFDLNLSCPAPLTSFSSSTVNASSSAACSDTIDQTYYVAHVNGSGGTLGLYDLVFSDSNGQFKLAAGFYQTNDAGTDEWYEVDANGVIVSFGDCLYNQFTVYFDITTAPNTYGWASSLAACAGTGTPLTVYIVGTEASLYDVFLAGKVLYTDAGLTTPLDGNNTWFKTVSAPALGESFLLDGVGVISNWGGPC